MKMILDGDDEVGSSNDCDNRYGSKLCIENFEKLKHVGTKNKIEFMKKYADSWYSIVLRAGYKGVVFIDCMSNAGAYNYEGNAFSGTSQRIMESFLQDTQFKNSQFIISVNDYLERRIKCQNCIWEKCEQEYGEKGNVSFIPNVEDVSLFLKGRALRMLERAKKLNYHVLLFYDPYNAEIDWEGLTPFLEAKNVDIILNHFGSDTIRALHGVKKEVKVKKYEETYKLDYDKLLQRTFNGEKLPISFLRNRILEIVDSINKDKFVFYGPIFNSKNVVLYDIVAISKSERSCELLKRHLYSQFREIPDKKEDNVFQTSLFALEEDEEDLELDKLAEYGMTDKNYFYNPEQFARIIYSHFKGKKVTNTEYKNFLFFHDFIPTNANKQIDPILSNQYLVTIKKKNQKKNIPEKYYDFREEESKNE